MNKQYLSTLLLLPSKGKHLLLAVGVLLSMYTHAQVTVGAQQDPQDFSVLEISTLNTQGGLRFPRLTTAQRDALSQTPEFLNEMHRKDGTHPIAGKALGLTIYNTDTNCVEYWDGNRWVSQCYPTDLESIATGTGTFIGKTCFDIAQGNDNIYGCAPLTGSRTQQRAVFTNRTSQNDPPGTAGITTGVQVYTFKPSGTVSNVRFEYVDPTGMVIESLTPFANYSSMNDISTDCMVTVAYKESLNETLKGRTNQTALTADLYVVYNENSVGTGVEYKLKLTAVFKDCACCGAINEFGNWLAFMCHNLGADENVDPFTRVVGNLDGTGGTLGYLYQWGRRTDGHQNRNSLMTTTYANNNQATEPADVVGKFILTPFSPKDWRAGGGNPTRWGNGTQDYNPSKGSNDPCPTGWKVPSQRQLSSIFTFGGPANIFGLSNATVNPAEWVNDGLKIGTSLFFPATSYRREDNGTISGALSGQYYTSTIQGAGAQFMGIATSSVLLTVGMDRANGNSVRCIQDY